MKNDYILITGFVVILGAVVGRSIPLRIASGLLAVLGIITVIKQIKELKHGGKA